MNLISKIFIGIFLVFAINKTSCEKSNEVNGVIKDFTGLDGCTYIIELDDGQKLEPQLLPEGTVLIADRKVAIKYKPLTGRMSICMVGRIVEITSLRYL